MTTEGRDAAARARRAEIVEATKALEARYADWGERPGSFRYQYYVLGGRMQSVLPENLIPAVLAAYQSASGHRGNSSTQQAQASSAAVPAAAAAEAQQTNRQEGERTFGDVIESIIGMIVWTAIILGILWNQIPRWKYKLAMRPDRRHWAALGSGADERERAIDALFDAQKAQLSIGVFHRYDVPDGFFKQWLKFRISRSLATMEPRARELLRVAYHLYNSGRIDEKQWQHYRFAFLNGDGKASIDSFGHHSEAHKVGIRDGVSVVRFYQDAINGSVDAGVNALLGYLEKHGDKGLPRSVQKVRKRIHGGGTWLEEDEVGDTPFTTEETPGALLGDFPESGRMVRYAGEGSMITVAPPGSGKTQCHVFPTLLSWPGPAVILDVKGEIYAGTSKWRAENVGPVYKFAPLDPARSHSYNPLTTVRSSPEYLWEDARFLADMMMVPTGAKDPFWENRARDVLTAAIAKVCLEEDVDKRPLGDVLDIFHGVGWDEFIFTLQARVDIRSMTRAGHSLASMEPKTRDGVLQTGLSSISAWDGDRIDRTTRRSDWSPLDLRSGSNPTVYICLTPNEVESYISVLRVFIAQHIRLLTTELPPRDQSPILFLLDELPRLRQMPPVEEALEIGRQYGIKLWMFTQSIGQLKTAYENADGMIGSCAVRMYMNPSLHDETAKKISEDIGMQEGVLDRDRQKVVEPTELAGPEFRDNVIVMASGCKPLRLNKHFAWKDPVISQRMGSL